MAEYPYPLVLMLPGRQKRLISGHPWVYSNEIQMSEAAKALPPGALMRLATASGEIVGTGMFNPNSLIAFRLLTRSAQATIDENFIAGQLRAALALRDRLFAEPYYRLIHAEADGLPGTIIDRYGDVIVLQANSAGSYRLLPLIRAALTTILAPQRMIERSDASALMQDGLALPETDIAVEPITAEMIENGTRFRLDLAQGQKTGWFYDHRDNRRFVAELAKGGRVLDLFSYGGGFGITALVHGAAEALLIDRSAPALAAASANAALNDVAARITTRQGDVTERLSELGAAGEKFDIVVADPPAYVKSKKHLGVGLRAYQKLYRQAAALVRPGGFLLAASCSHNVDNAAFLTVIRDALGRAGRNGRIIRFAGAAADHPVHPALPESAYLKAAVIQLD